jgi:hypothetical protein
MVTLITYSHDKCKDLHLPYITRLKRFFPSLSNHMLMSNESGPLIDFVYRDGDPHYNQMIQCLSEIKDDFIIYSQEDYILFDDVNFMKIEEYVDILSKNDQLHFIRLIMSGVGNSTRSFNTELSYVDRYSPYFFSTQVTIWKRSSLVKMFERSKSKSIFDEPHNSKFLRELSFEGLYTTKLGTATGAHHNSLIYPYIATALVKGKWNVSEYPKELEELFYDHKINKNIRGVR